ncbi:hypothetical protein QTI51_37510 [Variovorax sp. J22G73]|uniref:hypothetical protein n=1 Tax=unclassified Variovorax TaxID=663243 RepID=UPI002575F362|nr:MULTISPECIES: hypothetical protein [unclassified Variovorax]MDM0010117.1 hypothetical protein [Variovorax sp. J22R203]MDM0103024.1 hypothetical protein [Variovorax sp. J22G73]
MKQFWFLIFPFFLFSQIALPAAMGQTRGETPQNSMRFAAEVDPALAEVMLTKDAVIIGEVEKFFFVSPTNGFGSKYQMVSEPTNKAYGLVRNFEVLSANKRARKRLRKPFYIGVISPAEIKLYEGRKVFLLNVFDGPESDALDRQSFHLLDDPLPISRAAIARASAEAAAKPPYTWRK